MALLGRLLLAAFLLVAAPSWAHQMGRSIPLLYGGGEGALLAAHVVAAYFTEQMGYEVRPRELGAHESARELLKSQEAPWIMELLPLKGSRVWDGIAMVPMDSPFPLEGRIAVLSMTAEASRDLKFSLVPRYLEKLRSGLAPGDWEEGLARVRSGEGARKVALDMLRKRDLL